MIEPDKPENRGYIRIERRCLYFTFPILVSSLLLGKPWFIHFTSERI